MRKYGEDFAEDARLNKMALADEAEIQPTLTDHYGKLFADARATRDRIQVALKLKRAEANLNFRIFPPDNLKITEAVIEALIDADAGVQSLEAELLTAKEQVYIYEAAMSAMSDKSSMIKVLQSLWSGGYFSAS